MRWPRFARDERGAWDKALAELALPMHPAHIGAVCREGFPADSVLVADGGNATIWAMFHHKVTVPNTVISTFKFGMLGAGVSQAVAAALARPAYAQPLGLALGCQPFDVDRGVANAVVERRQIAGKLQGAGGSHGVADQALGVIVVRAF